MKFFSVMRDALRSPRFYVRMMRLEDELENVKRLYAKEVLLREELTQTLDAARNEATRLLMENRKLKYSAVDKP